MKLSLATRIFLGYALVLLTFGAVSLFSVAELHRNRLEIRLVSQGYLQLSQDAAALETFQTSQEKDTERVLEQNSVETRRALIRLASLYYAPQMAQRLEAARAKAREVLTFAPEGEVPFVMELDSRFAELSRNSKAYGHAVEAVFTALASESPESQEVARATNELRQLESVIGRELRVLRATLTNRIRERVDGAEERERRTGLTIIALSIMAIGVGVGVTAWSARTLRPVRTLIEGVSRIGRGDYSAQLGVRGEDEVALLAREFDQMARSLQAREAQLKSQAEALMRAEQLAAVGRISAQIVHEVRNPLSSIGLNVELLQDAVDSARFDSQDTATEARELLSAVTHEVDRLTDVTEQYLRMARPARPDLEPEDITAVLDGVLDFTREELVRAGVEVVRDFAPGTPRVLADQGQLRQVFLNLLRNSREAMPTGGRLTVATVPREGDVEVTVRDTGAGMTEEARRHLFEPFFTTKEGGTGLGLAVSQQILQAHGGSLSCQSIPGQGTTFVLRLPRA
ncbi:HAMP domain-containing protein [Corallococcus sp. CA049B]|uniref:histidine kinase n=1 Tax=Corallococcus coralloides TaxID=184914 RepID=A0A410RPY3_CORCK|nr:MULTISPECIES: HAMP domain-containing sensor histidine kinase [Corallococcus]NOJ94269.1 HAMP domain-containing protein [Corallococcus coralloides]QAT83916.1 sensor histidine kinase [Corallococcus coralloides]RKG88455.1 HAMP domain-containing protein [Corallococcus sp. CA049B]